MWRTILLSIQLLVAVVAGVARAVVRRMRRGPAAPRWSWTIELRAAALRAFIMGARRHPDPNARRRLEAALDPPLPRDLRGLMRVEVTQVAGLSAEVHRRAGGEEIAETCTLLYLHGGGYVAGNAATHRRWVARLTWAVQARSVVPNYRLAPTHPYPAALDDALASYRELLAGGIAPESIFLAGDSAGGGLAAALLLRLRDGDEVLPAGALLFSPYTDLEHTGASIAENAHTDYLPLGPVRPNWEYLGDHDVRDPYVSPIYGEYSGVPPLLVFAGGREMILDDSTRLVDAVRATGGDARLHVAEDMYHVWPALLPHHPETATLLARCAEFIQTHRAGVRRGPT